MGIAEMIAAARSYFDEVWEAWNEFWFTPSSPSTLSAIRVLAGMMLLYTPLVWSFNLTGFFGENGYLPQQLVHDVNVAENDPDGPNGPAPAAERFRLSHFNYVHGSKMMWTIHIAALAVFFLLTIGLFSRTMACLAYLFAVSYANRI